MKANQIQTYSKKLLPFATLCGLILLFVYGLSLTGSDLTFSARMGQGGLSAWLTMTENSGGTYLSALLSAVCIDIPVLRHILVTAMLSTALITLLFFCSAERSYVYYCIVLLGLVPASGIFAHTFGSILGAVSVLIPAFLTVLYLFTVSDLFTYKGRKKSWKIPFLFLSGLVAQLFSEDIGIALLILSLLFLFGLIRKHGFSYHLAAHSFGSLLGFFLTLFVSGGENYFVDSFYTMLDQLTLALDQLFVENLLLLGLLTIGCLILIQPIRSERSKNCNKTLVLILLPTVLFIFLNLVGVPFKAFPVLYRYLTVLKLIATIGYFYGILRTLEHYVSKDRTIRRTRLSLMTVTVFIPVFAFSGVANPAMLYIPHLCLVAVTVMIFLYGLHRNSKLEKIIRKPMIFIAILGVVAMIFVNGANGYYTYAVDTHIRESLEQGITELILPEAPYMDRIPTATYTQLSDYYDFPSYGNVEISYVPFGQWDWNTYYEVHHVPVIEEYDEEAAKTEEWTYNFEED